LRVSTRTRYGGVLRAAVSFGLLGLVAFFFRERLPAVAACLRGISLPLFLASLGVFGGVIACNALRLTLFLHFHSINLPFVRVLYFNMIALFVNLFLPSTLAGDAAKAYYIHQCSGGRREVFGLVILDRFFGLTSLVALSCTALIFSGPGNLPVNIRLTIYIMIAMTALAVLFLVHPGIAGLVDRFLSSLPPNRLTGLPRTIYSPMQLSRYNSRIVLKALCLSLGAQFFYILNYYLISKSLGIELPLTFFIFFVPINIVLGLVPSINGLGLREVAYLFYATEYIGSEEALALSLLSTFTLLLAGCLGGVVYFISGTGKPGTNIGRCR